jgi:hypothetical protein
MITRMKLRSLAVAFVACLAVSAWAQEQAFTNRATDLKDKADGATVKSLPENTEVKVVQRAGGWTRVDVGGQQGWVRVFHLRFPATAQADSSGGGLSSLGSALGLSRQRSQSATIATTGIRGLSQEDLKNASPNEAALKQMHSYRSDAGGAERFAKEGRLAVQQVQYSEGGRK